jgi:hypothetical protein
MSYIVPHTLSEAIYKKVDAALKDQPDAAPDREYFYGILLDYYNEHGVIPDFTLKVRILSTDIVERTP